MQNTNQKMQVNLPQELIDHIIEELGADQDIDRKVRGLALRACSQAAWALFLPSRKILFFDVVLIGEHSKELVNFLQILEYDPARSFPGLPPLASQVQSLTIVLPDCLSHGNLADIEAERKTSLYSVILPLLTRVQKLTLKFPYGEAYSWQLVGETTKSALLDFSKSQAITTLDVRDVDKIPANFFTNFSDLKNLTLHRVSPDRDSSESWLTAAALTDSQQWKPTLQTLSIHRSGKIAFLLSEIHRYNGFKARPPSYLASVWNMDASVYYWDALSSESWPLIQAISSLRYLRISDLRHNHSDVTIFPGMVDFAILRNLEVLEFQGIFRVQDLGLSPFKNWPLFKIRDLAISASIRTLILAIEWAGCQNGAEENIFVPDYGWLNIDAALSSGRFPFLKTICLRLCVNYLWDGGMSAKKFEQSILNKLEAKISQLFPSASKSKSIEIDVSVKDTDAYITKPIVVLT